ncbi:hypothetical protein JRO89_XS02G0072700 [Xanthoceras sorbifolium]|uniref:Uncharacterized protein n=1 Tax=Xanthoceras sorbifolium TaxID=99658 RepID=A0ABQ8IF37_9ROSI|nr:hypothetical protein JRO89_XS02G0072700 [Xanthoceras sorbifolium]
MVEEGGGGCGDEDFLIWDNCQPWGASILDNSGGRAQAMGLLVGKKPPLPQLPSSSNNPPAVMASTDHKPEAAVDAPSKKRGRGGDGKESGGEADKSTIVDEAVNYIKTLQHTFQNLQRQKLERLEGLATCSAGPSTSTAPQKLDLNSSREAFLADQVSSGNSATVVEATNINPSNAISVPPAPYPVSFRTWSSSNVVLSVCGHEAQISICSQKKPGLYSTICYVFEKHKIEMVSALFSSYYTRRTFMIQAKVNRVSDQSPEANNPAEEIFKQAASELISWISS